MNTHHYILAGRQIVPAINLISWAMWFEGPERFIAHARVRGHRVSTVFLGIDHNMTPCGPPVLFETAVFKGHNTETMLRSCTYEQAVRLHQLTVRELGRPWRYKKRDILPSDAQQHTARVYRLSPRS